MTIDRHAQLTPNFRLSEFVRDVDPLPPQPIIDNLFRLANRLQVIRDLLGKPIKITSGYRTKAHNEAVGGKPNSQHLYGCAADILIDGMPPRAVQEYLKNWNGGLGSYATFTHVDLAEKRRWNG